MDIRTLSILLGITNFLQAIAIFLLYRAHRTYRGIGWWALGFASLAIGFVLMILRDVISIELIPIIFGNALTVSGTTFLYIGIMRFLDKKENLRVLIPVFVVFILSFYYYTYGNNDITARTVIVSAVLALISFYTAQALFINKIHAITTAVNFNTLVFLANGCFCVFRVIATIVAASVDNYFTPTILQVGVFLASFIEGILLTYGLIIMVNQRLSADTKEANQHFELIFSTGLDATLITRLQDGVIANVNEGFTTLTGFTRDEVIGRSSLEINIWKDPADRQKFIEELNEKGFCENFEAIFQRKDGRSIIGSMSAKIINLQGLPHIISVTRDISGRKHFDGIIETRLELLEFAATHSLDELLQKGLDEIGNLTQSPIGFYHFVDPDQMTLSLQAWSTRTSREFCKAEGKGMHYSIDLAGVWVDCIHQRQPVIHNDYASLPHRKGLPPGHAQVTRELVVPIFRDGRVVSILGVGNKPADYNETDVASVTYFADVLWEISKRKQAENALHQSEMRFRALFEQTNEAVILFDLEGHSMAANLYAADMLGYQPDESMDISVIETTPNVDGSQSIIARLLAGEHIPFYEKSFAKKDGASISVEINMNLVRDKNEHPLHIQCTIRDISQRKQAEDALRTANEQLKLRMTEVELLQEELREQALHDPLTGLHNRRYLNETMTREILRAGRENYPVSVIVSDVDNFKLINDTYGHQAGDKFLVALAALIKSHTRGSDVVCRYGGEEFLLILPGASLASAQKRAEEIRQECAEFILPYEGKDLKVTMSFGVATYPTHAKEAEQVIIKADKALYLSKDKGRNQVTVWNEENETHPPV